MKIMDFFIWYSTLFFRFGHYNEDKTNGGEQMMEVHVETETLQPVDNEVDQSLGKLKKKVFGLIIFQVVIVIGFAVLFAQQDSIRIALESKVKVLETQVAAYDEQIKTSMSIAVESQMSNYMSEGLVTDTLVAQKLNVSGKNVSLDIRPQPLFASHFLGQGRFDLSDRELKQNVIGLIEKFKSQYGDYGLETKFEDLTISVTQNNYDVGTYSNGTLKLIGEN